MSDDQNQKPVRRITRKPSFLEAVVFGGIAGTVAGNTVHVGKHFVYDKDGNHTANYVDSRSDLDGLITDLTKGAVAGTTLMGLGHAAKHRLKKDNDPEPEIGG